MNTFIFTDIHGCLDELMALFKLAGITNSDTVISAGDMVDRGPNSAGVVEFLYRRSLRAPTVSVMGNHDYKHKKYRVALRENSKLAAELAAKRPEMARIHESLSADAAAWMDSSHYSYVDQSARFSIVHGGITPHMKGLPTEHGRKSDPLVMYVRYIGSEGQMLRLGEERPDSRYWADIYDGRFGHVIFGHQAFTDSEAPVTFPHATGLDLGCCFGGRLACLKFTDDGGRDSYTVKAYSEYVKRKG